MRESLIPVEVTVTLWIKPSANISDLIQEMEYDFKHEDNIVDMQIVDFNT